MLVVLSSSVRGTKQKSERESGNLGSSSQKRRVRKRPAREGSWMRHSICLTVKKQIKKREGWLEGKYGFRFDYIVLLIGSIGSWPRCMVRGFSRDRRKEKPSRKSGLRGLRTLLGAKHFRPSVLSKTAASTLVSH